ncbi:hypothetical protein V501_09696 [Pseudogymnoascus sp. VKM F-4519 (FW-2642)]|nr:hypothetical protein V501_09696 [Pseudogymnoascus sp. VKM F-4519 (FW-2642)]
MWVAYALPDGRRKINFYSNGVLDGSAIETEDGATFFEADGTEVDLNEIDEVLSKRVSKWRLAIKFAKLIAKYGKKAWNYIYCVGTSATWKCGDEYLGCSASGIPPWKCVEGIVCIPGAWNSAWEAPPTTAYDFVDAHLPVPPQPSPPVPQSRRPPPPPPPSQSRRPPPPPPSQTRRTPPPPPPSQNRTVSPSHPSQSRSESPPPPLQSRRPHTSPPPSQNHRVSPPRPSQSRPEFPLPPLQSRLDAALPPWQGLVVPLSPPSQRRHVSLPTIPQNRSEYPPPLWQGRLAERRRGSVPTATQPGVEYEFFADSSEDENDTAIEDQRKPIVIAVFGKTGTGKTSFINAVTGRSLKVGHGLTSCTEDVLAVSCRIGSENIILVDTPGFSDTHLTDTEILRRIAGWMKDSYDDGFLLSGIIYLHNINDIRMDGPSLKNLRMMQKLCGANSLKNVVLATTMWEKVDMRQGMERELELQKNFWKDMINEGSTVARIMTETGGEARELVLSLLNNQPLSTKLQEELQSGTALVQTEAGTEIRAEMIKLILKLRNAHEADIADLKLAQQARESTQDKSIGGRKDRVAEPKPETVAKGKKKRPCNTMYNKDAYG